MKQTVNLKLNKPDAGDPVKISDLNENADILDTAVSNKLDKVGAVVDYTADPKQMQVRNSKIADAKPADSEGKDGDMVFIPGSSTIDPSILDGKLDKAGDTMTGKLTVGQASMDTNGYVEGTWLRTTKATNNASVPDEVAVLVNGWIYYVTKAQLISALGIDQCALKSDISAVYKAKGSCTTAELASKAKETGDVWNLTDAGQYGPAGTNVLWTGMEWDALSGIVDLSTYAKKSEIPDISGKADKSEIPDISGKADKSEIPDISGKLNKIGDTMTGPLTVNTNGAGVKFEKDAWSMIEKMHPNGTNMAVLLFTPSHSRLLLSAGQWSKLTMEGNTERPEYSWHDTTQARPYKPLALLEDVDGKLDKSGGTMTGQLADVKAKQVRNIIYSVTEPPDLAEGDIWVSPGGLPDANGVSF